jgi:hypothetical protein
LETCNDLPVSLRPLAGCGAVVAALSRFLRVYSQNFFLT